ncbi:hypothetical protein [Verrucosispora sp. WMMD573]|uniref:hypothetical protein n=1 Tax=Verrucosispora sp. WMMD573 TaxID=3015149 RepID=UPI00248C41B5|nr:hypothetical protein [Verrucosispora sp. WMMD573]WBB55483.1 hypothetical protein O7601_05025 [Verrucosispora sp. WMMD573]
MSTLLVVAWTVLVVRNRRVGWRFFAVGVGLILACFVGGPVAERMTASDAVCPPQQGLACGMGGVTGAAWANGALALGCLAVLLVLTPLTRLLRR